MVAGLGFGAVALGVVGGLPPVIVAMVAALMPAVAFAVAGRLPGRGAVVGCLVLALGATLVRPAAGGVPWAALAVMGLLTASAVAGGELARGMEPRPRTPCTLAGAEGHWMTIVIFPGGPADAAGTVVRPRVSPRNDPERRRLGRLAGERRREVVRL
ncbi:MAG: hypothetical protein IRY99_06190 [Isosphaeraceae bacterium]|nr:hypothetical protein [Isosphaeraceae bacterium]